LLRIDALNGLYERLRILRLELFAFANIQIKFSYINTLRKTVTIAMPLLSNNRSELLDQQILQIESEIQADLSQARKHQTDRLALPPLPKFPSTLAILLAKELGRPMTGLSQT
jgi:hypothetical protein